MLVKSLSVLLIFLIAAGAIGQTRSFDSPTKSTRAVIIPVRVKGCPPSDRVDMRSATGRLLRRKSFPRDYGEGVAHVEWTADGRFFVFNTNLYGGHQPWHWFTYVYSIRTNRFYSLDSRWRAITSDFKLAGETLVTTRSPTLAAPTCRLLLTWRSGASMIARRAKQLD